MLVKPDFNNKQDFTALKKSIEAQKLMMTFSQYKWWQELLQNPENIINGLGFHMPWFLEILMPPSLRHNSGVHTAGSPLMIRMQKDFDRPAVYSGKFRKTTPKERENSIQVTVGIMVLYKESQDAQERKVGKVLDISQDKLIVRVYEGTIATAWKPTVGHRRCIINVNQSQVSNIFHLTPSNRLPARIMFNFKEQEQ